MRALNCVAVPKHFSLTDKLLRVTDCQSEIFAEIGPHRPKNSRFSSSDSFRVILIADEIETRYDFITSCMVVPNCSLLLALGMFLKGW